MGVPTCVTGSLVGNRKCGLCGMLHGFCNFVSMQEREEDFEDSLQSPETNIPLM